MKPTKTLNISILIVLILFISLNKAVPTFLIGSALKSYETPLQQQQFLTRLRQRRSLASGRWGLRPGKRSDAVEQDYYNNPTETQSTYSDRIYYILPSSLENTNVF